MNEIPLTTVYETTNPVQAQIIKTYLQSEGLEVFGTPNTQGGYAGVLNIQLKVASPEAERAKYLIDHPPRAEESAEEETEAEDQESSP